MRIIEVAGMTNPGETNGGSACRSRLRFDSRVAWQGIDGRVVLLELRGGKAIGLNPTASHIWPMLEDFDEDAIARSLVDAFEVDFETARSDVHRFVDSCLRSSYLVPADKQERP